MLFGRVVSELTVSVYFWYPFYIMNTRIGLISTLFYNDITRNNMSVIHQFSFLIKGHMTE